MEMNKEAWMKAAKANAEVIQVLKRDLRRAQSNSFSGEAAVVILKREVEFKDKEIMSLKTDVSRWKKEANNLKKKLALAGGASVKENAEVAAWFRNHLDEGHPMDDNHWEKKARQVMWNEEDARMESEDG